MLFSLYLIYDVGRGNDVVEVFFSFCILSIFSDFWFFIMEVILVGIDVGVICLVINVYKCFIIFYLVIFWWCGINFDIIRGCYWVVVGYICCMYGNKIFYIVI